jgi:hypothetical protein
MGSFDGSSCYCEHNPQGHRCTEFYPSSFELYVCETELPSVLEAIECSYGYVKKGDYDCNDHYETYAGDTFDTV